MAGDLGGTSVQVKGRARVQTYVLGVLLTVLFGSCAPCVPIISQKVGYYVWLASSYLTGTSGSEEVVFYS